MKAALVFTASLLLAAPLLAQPSLKLDELKATSVGDEIMLDTRDRGVTFERGDQFTLYDYDGVAQTVEVTEVMSSGKIIVKAVPRPAIPE